MHELILRPSCFFRAPKFRALQYPLMRSPLIVVALSCITLFFSACTYITKVSDSQAYVSSIDAEILKRHLSVIASDSLEGREMATEGEHKTTAYISGVFRSIGLKQPMGTNNYLQGFEVVKDSIVAATIQIDGKTFSLFTYGRIEPWLNNTADLSTSEIVFAGYGIDTLQYNDYANIDVNGKTVLICDGEPKADSSHFSHYIITGTTKRSPWSRYPNGDSKKLAAAKAHGAKAVFVFDPSLDTIAASYIRYAVGGFHPPHSEETEQNNICMVIGNPIAKVLLGEAKYNEIFSLLHSKKGLPTSFTIEKPLQYHFKKETAHKTSNNVVGYIEGTDKKNEYVIVSAHNDHLGTHNGMIYHGADDNGSGTSGLMGIAQAFATAASKGMRPRRSVIFLSVTGEEKGLFGSKNYVAHPLFPLEQTVADVNTDMIGRVDSAHEARRDSNYLYVIGAGRLSSELYTINERNNKEHIGLKLDYLFDSLDDPNRFYYRSDHYEFAQKNIPIVFYFDGVHKDYHRPSDTFDKIDFPLMATRARLAFLTAWEIANRDERLKVDRTDHSPPAN